MKPMICSGLQHSRRRRLTQIIKDYARLLALWALRRQAMLGLQTGLNLVSLSLGQLSVSHLLFTLVGKGDEGTGRGPPTYTQLYQSAAVII